MFIEPGSETTSKLRRSKIAGLAERQTALLRSFGPLSGNISYKHLAALRPGARFVVTNLETAPQDQLTNQLTQT